MPPPLAQPYPGVCSVRQAYVKRGIPDECIDIMLQSLSKNTLNQYNVALKQWFSFCQINNIDMYNGSVADILKFLTEKYHANASYGTLNSFRSSLSLIMGKDRCNNDCVSRFLKGVFKSKPCFPKYNCIWDPNLVLDYLSGIFPNDAITMENLTKKLVTLLALSTGQRVQTLSLINVADIQIQESRIIITVNDIIKTSAPNRHNPRLIIPFFKEKDAICPALALSCYVERTRNLRSGINSNKLILTIKKPIHNASPQTISRWIKQTLSSSGVDINTFTAHSTRHASTSSASRSGISTDIIKRTAGWSGNSLCFARFYNQPLINTEEDCYFARAVLNS